MAWSEHRIHDSGDFRSVTRRGGRGAQQHLITHLAVLEGSDPGPRIGFIVSKKVGNSVVRHRLIRRLREVFRTRMADLPLGATVVVRALPGAGELDFSRVEDEFSRGLQRAQESWERRSRGERAS